MSPRSLSLGDRGLDLVLDGGVRWVERVSGHESATVLVRGPAGAGKTLWALHTALATARALGGDIAYACVELFPAELYAQARSVLGDRADLVLDERQPPAKGDARTRLIARLLDLPNGASSLSDALVGLWESPVWEERLGPGRRPKVLVIDSLIDGYGLGASASRELADAVCKLAAQWNIALVLVEEAAPGAPSPWVFAADTVFELSIQRDDVTSSVPAPTERRLLVEKHRFAASDAGPHRFAFEEGKLAVFPRPSAWLEPWSLRAFRSKLGDASEKPGVLVYPTAESPPSGESAAGHIAFVYGPSLSRVRHYVEGVGRSRGSADGVTVRASFLLPIGKRRENEREITLGLGHPYLSAHRMLRLLFDQLEESVNAGGRVHRVVVGDLATMRSFWDAEGLLRGLGVLCAVARMCGIAVVIYEETASRVGYAGDGRLLRAHREPGIAPPPASAFADVVLEIAPDPLQVNLEPVNVQRRS